MTRTHDHDLTMTRSGSARRPQKERPQDRGGYFVVGGREGVLVSQTVGGEVRHLRGLMQESYVSIVWSASCSPSSQEWVGTPSSLPPQPAPQGQVPGPRSCPPETPP